MSEFQAIIEFYFQINKFVNIDLFQRGCYQVRLKLSLPDCKLPYKIEINSKNSCSSSSSSHQFPNGDMSFASASASSSSINAYSLEYMNNTFKSCSDASISTTTTSGNGSNIVKQASIINGALASKTFQILYKNEEIPLNDSASYQLNIRFDTSECLKQTRQISFLLNVELWFTEQESILACEELRLACVSTRHLQIHFDLCRGVHYNLPVLFDYFHLSGITLSVHGSLVSICHPYICRNESTDWLINSTNKQILDGNVKDNNDKKISPRNGESEHSMQLGLAQVRRLQLTQWRLISIILCAFLTLRRKIDEYYRLLPPWQQARNKFDSLFVDISLDKLSYLSQECFKALDKNENLTNTSTMFVSFQNSHLNTYLSQDVPTTTSVKVDDLLIIIERDISYLCGLTVDQWQLFLRLITSTDRINQHLAKVHHLQRIKRFAEGFFCVELPRSNLYALCDQSCSLFGEISDLVRKSNYFSMLPPCEVECVYMDGDAATLPIIFEQKYECTVPLVESKASKQSVSKLLSPTITTTTTTTTAMASLSDSNSTGYFSSPSKQSSSATTSPSTTSTSSTRSNIKSIFARLNSISTTTTFAEKSNNNNHNNNSSNNKKEINLINSNKSANLQKEVKRLNTVNAMNFIGLCSNEMENDYENVNRKIKLVNTLLSNKKELIKSYSKLSLDLSSDKKWKNGLTSGGGGGGVDKSQNSVTQLLRNTISVSPTNIGFLSSPPPPPLPSANLSLPLSLPYQVITNDKRLECRHSWPNLTTTTTTTTNEDQCMDDDNDSKHPSKSSKNLKSHRPQRPQSSNSTKRSDGNLVSKANEKINDNLRQLRKSVVKSTKEHKSKNISYIDDEHEQQDYSSLVGSSTGLLSLTNTTNYTNFQGTMYFPKPPKEFAMEGIEDEPAEEVNLKPIPVANNNNNPNTTTVDDEAMVVASSSLSSIDSTKITLQLNDAPLKSTNLQHKPIDHLNVINSASCQDLTTMVHHQHHHHQCNSSTTTINSNDKNCFRLNNPSLFNDSKFTFLELLRSDHCLICCGTVKNNNADKSSLTYHCRCNKNNNSYHSVKHQRSESPPSLRPISSVNSELISFLHAKEEFREQILQREKNLLFYSDFHTLASRIPYFQCDSDFRAFNTHRELHLVVCVHGLDGNSADLRLVRTYLELGLPTNNFVFLMSQRNQGETFDSLETLTSRLVNEIENYIKTYNLKPSRLSFIGHSLGNIIIRAAISRRDFMKRWQDKLYTFLSLSGPHLGLAYNRSGLVNMGLWFIQKFKKSASLTQLSMKDSANIRQSYLYQLSTKSGLENFQNILLCGSSQDYYVPIHSAHIELCSGALNDCSENGIAYREMTNNILERLCKKPNLNIVRYDVHHSLSSSANTLIGRAAHIAVLDSELFIEKFMVVVGLKYFL